MDDGDGVAAEKGVGPAGDFQVVGEVAGGVLGCHAGEGVADADPLVQGGEHAEAEPVPQGGLPDQQSGERRPGVHVVVRHHPDRFQLLVVQQVRLVDFTDR